jgi:hypothetical protein
MSVRLFDRFLINRLNMVSQHVPLQFTQFTQCTMQFPGPYGHPDVTKFEPLSIPEPNGPASLKLKEMFGKYMKVEVTDGRIFVGMKLN